MLPTLQEIIRTHDPAWMGIEPTSRGASGHRAEREWRGAIAALEAMLRQQASQLQENLACEEGADRPRVPTDFTSEDPDGSRTPAVQAQNFSHPGDRPSQGNPPGATAAPAADQGLLMAGPTPVLSCPVGLESLSVWTFTPSLDPSHWLPRLPGCGTPLAAVHPSGHAHQPTALPLLPGDPLAQEQFCIFLTPFLSGVMVRGDRLMLSFLPEVVEQAWQAMRLRLQLTHSPHLATLTQQIQAFPLVLPDYVRVMQFHQHLLALLPEPVEDAKPEPKGFAHRVYQAVAAVEQLATGEVAHWKPLSPSIATIAAAVGQPPGRTKGPGAASAVGADSSRDTPAAQRGGRSMGPPRPPGTKTSSAKALDLELLQAIAHEVRTPLTTIRTMTRSLMKRKDITAEALKRLTVIDRECSEQIDRFSLFFRAVELETASPQTVSMALTRTPLDQVFTQSVPRWQQQAEQRGLQLDVCLPQTMPAVVSDPAMLDQALSSLIERFTRNLPGGSHIQVEVRLAGSQLKVQLKSDTEARGSECPEASPLKALGQLLMFQPDTGSLSLNLNVTKNLFQALGGKLTVREKPLQGEVLTVYLPLERDTNVLEV